MKKVKIWMFQNNLSGNANGHFDFVELHEKSTKKDVLKYASSYFYKIWGIKSLGVFTSGIGNRDFPSDRFLKKIKTEI